MKTTIRRKLLRSIIALLTLLYAFTGIAIGIYVHTLLVEQSVTNNRQVLMQAIQQTDVMFQLSDLTARQIMTDSDIEEVLQEARQEQYSRRYVILSRGGEILTRHLASNPFAANIVIFTPDSLTLSNQHVLMVDHFRDREQMEWFSAFSESEERRIVSTEHTTMAFGNMQSVISLAYKYRILPHGQLDNYLMIDIPAHFFRNLLQTESDRHGLLILNDQGQTIVASDLLSAEDLESRSSQERVYFLSDTITIYERIEPMGWNLYYSISRSEFNLPIIQLLMGFIAIYLLVFLVSILLLSKRISAIVKPVHRIVSKMQEAYNGNLDVYIGERTNDEFEILSDCFNKLVSDLKTHIQQIFDEENTKNEMQIDLLISQIHPHFIYNTLNLATYLIEEDEGESAIDVIYALINILQNVVRIGSREIYATMAEELEMLKAYAEIASLRYPKIFELEVECDSLLFDEKVPKILIQPLVENAILHGIIPRGKPSHIWVSIRSIVPQHIDICVEDDGIGVTQDRIDAVWHCEKGSTTHGVGIANIRNRIKFLYENKEYHFDISPRSGGGTKVYIRLPLRGQKN